MVILVSLSHWFYGHSSFMITVYSLSQLFYADSCYIFMDGFIIKCFEVHVFSLSQC